MIFGKQRYSELLEERELAYHQYMEFMGRNLPQVGALKSMLNTDAAKTMQKLGRELLTTDSEKRMSSEELYQKLEPAREEIGQLLTNP